MTGWSVSAGVGSIATGTTGDVVTVTGIGVIATGLTVIGVTVVERAISESTSGATGAEMSFSALRKKV